MTAFVVWLIAAVLLAIGELGTPGMFFLGPIALAALAAAITGLVGGGVVLQLIVFIAGSLASLLLLRPVARRHLSMPVLAPDRHGGAGRPKSARPAARGSRGRAGADRRRRVVRASLLR